jgi:hypothetical protein
MLRWRGGLGGRFMIRGGRDGVGRGRRGNF